MSSYEEPAHAAGMTERSLLDGPCRCPDPFAEEPCGCGTGHHARTYRDEVVHLRGRHWRVGCAFDALLPVQEGLAIVAGGPDGRGRTHGSILHDVIRIGDFAERVLAGEDPAAVLEDMSGPRS